jgi:natural product precursor
MKKNELPKLKLNKRTIANLNNMEMRYVLGGGGDDEDISRNHCEEEIDPVIASVLKEKIEKIILSQLLNCKIG